MFAWVSPTAGHFLHVLTHPRQVVAPGLQPKIPLGGWPLLPEFCTRVRQRPGCQSRWIFTRLKRNRGECICGSRLTAGAPFDHPTHSPLKAQYASVSKKLQAKPKSCSVACHRTYLTRPHTNIPTVRLPFETANIAQ
ncbi:hypothetical protein O181_089676 [Austropuccinia psidii MF-1]|uniref:Uncharacterized protein n=1 Tax=Austropuccinia psidii MF-1 TaxID=1389203 RepID=A0A9Q3IU17_9BASI|nr:hypothetical protein [Austropuccinia psidii MF-1]